LEARVTELAGHAARVAYAEQALFEAHDRAEAALRRAEMLEGEMHSARVEADRLRQRVMELEASLRTALAQVGEIASERIRADRLEAERDAARDQASAERSLSLTSQARAAEAEGRLAALEARLVSLDRRLSDITLTMTRPGIAPGDVPDQVIDIREPEVPVAAAPSEESPESPEAAKPDPGSRWSQWRTT
jgi:hypothetical protein